MAKPDLKEKIGQGWAACKGFLVKRWTWVVAALVLALFALIYAGYWVPATGFGGHPNAKGEWQREKTLWDWLDLLFVPLVLAAGAALFTWVTNRREREAEELRIKEQQRIELDRSRDAALQTYLDRVSALLRSRWREVGGGFLEANIIRAQTLTVLRQLDGQRKGLLLQFLYESGLIGRLNEEGGRQEPLVDLDGANLSEAHLRRVSLNGASLFRVDLRRADLHGAYLEATFLGFADLGRADLRWAFLGDANLSKADLGGADLGGSNPIGADLGEADLCGTSLLGADLFMADLTRANLHEANLEGANLFRANLSGAAVTDEQLAQAESLEGATLPDGTIYTSKPEPAPSETEPQDAEEQPDQPGDLDAGDNDQGMAE